MLSSSLIIFSVISIYQTKFDEFWQLDEISRGPCRLPFSLIILLIFWGAAAALWRVLYSLTCFSADFTPPICSRCCCYFEGHYSDDTFSLTHNTMVATSADAVVYVSLFDIAAALGTYRCLPFHTALAFILFSPQLYIWRYYAAMH